MKKTLIILLISTVGLTNYTYAQVTFGVKAGLNLADLNGKNGGESFSDDTKIKAGFHVGATADFSLGENLFVQPALLFSTKGFKLESGSTKGTININYLEIPVNVGYKFGDFHVFAGPYLAFAISGETKIETNGVEVKTDIEFGSDEENDDYKSTDFGVNVGLGYQFSNFVISAQYGLGLSNILPGGDSDNSTKNAVIGISLGYKFGSAE